MTTATLTAMTDRDRAITHLFEIRESAVEDLRTMPLAKVDSEWQKDRIRDIEWANRGLVRLGVFG